MVGLKRCGQKCEVRFCSYLNIYRFHSIIEEHIKVSASSLPGFLMRTVALWRSGSETLAGTNEVSFLKIKWGGGSLIQKFLTIRQATKKKSKKEKKDKFANHGVGQKTYYNFDFNVNFLFFISFFYMLQKSWGKGNSMVIHFFICK